jgi:predicted metalloprotease
MSKAILCCLTLCAIAIGGPADAKPAANRTPSTEQHQVRVSGRDYEESPAAISELPRQPSSATQTLLTAIETWIGSQFDLPAIHEHPTIEFVLPGKMTSLRFMGSSSDPGAQVAPNDSASSAQYDTVAIYHDATRTIYLPERWTGGTPAEVSVLVHEVVHHFQNVLGLKYECPQEREKLAYLAQERWLGLFGHSLADDFALDPFSLFVKTACFY